MRNILWKARVRLEQGHGASDAGVSVVEGLILIGTIIVAALALAALFTGKVAEYTQIWP